MIDSVTAATYLDVKVDQIPRLAEVAQVTMPEQLLPFYSFDSGAIINGRRDLFIPTTFGPRWTRIEGMIATGQVRAVDEGKYEIAKKDDDASNWVRAQTGVPQMVGTRSGETGV